MSINRTSSWITVALTVAAFGGAATLLADLDHPGSVEAAPAESPTRPQVRSEDLENRLRILHAELRIRADQDEGWQTFVRSMLQLQELAAAYQRRLTAGERIETNTEIVQHIFLYGKTMSDIEERLSIEQIGILRKSTADFGKQFICSKAFI